MLQTCTYINTLGSVTHHVFGLEKVACSRIGLSTAGLQRISLCSSFFIISLHLLNLSFLNRLQQLQANLLVLFSLTQQFPPENDFTNKNTRAG